MRADQMPRPWPREPERDEREEPHMVSTLKRLELRKQQCAALRATADALDAALAEALDEKRALRNRLVAEIAEHLPGDYESRRAEAEAKVIEFEDAFRAVMLRRKPSTPPNTV